MAVPAGDRARASGSDACCDALRIVWAVSPFSPGSARADPARGRAPTRIDVVAASARVDVRPSWGAVLAPPRVARDPTHDSLVRGPSISRDSSIGSVIAARRHAVARLVRRDASARRDRIVLLHGGHGAPYRALPPEPKLLA